MKPKHLFFVVCAAFLAIAVKAAMAGDKYVALLTTACAVAAAANALRPDANKPARWTDIKRLFTHSK